MLNLTFLFQTENEQEDSVISYRMVHLTLKGTKKIVKSVILKELKAKSLLAFKHLRILSQTHE